MISVRPLSWLTLACLLPALATAASLRVDHITVAGRDLKTLQAQFQAAGIATQYGGKHTNGQTEMAVASFPDGSYLELIAAQDPEAGAGTHYWGRFIDGNAGPCAWAVGSRDIEADAARLGGHVSDGGRKRPDGVELRWRSTAIGAGVQGTLFPFLIQDVTDRKLRVYPAGGPSNTELAGVAAVFILVRDLDRTIGEYRRTFGLGQPVRSLDRELGAKLARFPGSPVVLAAAEGPVLTRRLADFGEGPFAFVFAAAGAHPSTGAPVKWLPVPGMRIGVVH